MSVRTIIEVNHDQIHLAQDYLLALTAVLRSTELTRLLNQGEIVTIGPYRVLAQRHHSQELNLFIK